MGNDELEALKTELAQTRQRAKEAAEEVVGSAPGCLVLKCCLQMHKELFDAQKEVSKPRPNEDTGGYELLLGW